jgi:hemerythrin
MQAPFVWTDLFKLGLPPMDHTHAEFVQLVAEMEGAADAAFVAVFERFVTHAEAHFAQEKQWMEASAFPPRDCHVQEHERVLHALYEVRPVLLTGRIDMGRSLVQALREWFPNHADFMDAALAQWMVKRQLGGKPVVLKRGVAQAAPADSATPA